MMAGDQTVGLTFPTSPTVTRTRNSGRRQTNLSTSSDHQQFHFTIQVSFRGTG